MKKNLLIFGLLAACCGGTIVAQSKINGAGALLMAACQESESAKKLRGVASGEVTAIVTMNDRNGAEAVEAVGCVIESVIGDYLIVRLPLDKVEELAALDQVKAIEFGDMSKPYMDVARDMTSVNAIHDGTADGLAGTSFTGKGVCAALYDTGLDPNHAAFRNADGSSRVKGIYVVRKESGSLNITDPTEIASFQTEEANQTHGTHVLGIIGGSRSVTGTYAQDGKSGAQTGAVPYYGVAPEADLIVGCGDFLNPQILSGVEKVIRRGKELGQPTVVNLSLGSNVGSHDMNSSTAKILDELSKDAIICISAGNEGESKMAIEKTFTNRSKTMNTFLRPVIIGRDGVEQDAPLGAMAAYTAEFWSRTSEEFEMTLVLYDKATEKVIDSKKIGNLQGRSFTWNASNSDAFKQNFGSGSYIRVYSNVDENTNRYYVSMEATTSYTSQTCKFGVNITGSNGNGVNCYVNALNYPLYSQTEMIFDTENVAGYTPGTPMGTINTMACGKKVISVGAYVSRRNAPYIGNGSYGGSGTVGALASFSSYGSAVDGTTGETRKLPIICAPGAQVVSAVSTYNMKLDANFDPKQTNAHSTQFERDSYFYPMQGTSMSSPFVAGTIALWLQACPSMTAEQCVDIVQSTAIKDDYVNGIKGNTENNNLRWGAGKINPLGGLKEALRLASLGNVAADDNGMNLIIQNLGGRNYEVCYVNADNIAVEVYTVQGAKVLAAAADGDTVNFDASALADGIYVVNVATPAGNIARKFVVK